MLPSRRAFLALTATGAAGLGAAAAARGSSANLPLLSTYVAGTERYAAPAVVVGLKEGDLLRLRREPNNPYDALAVAVWTANGKHKLGYVPRIHNQALANLMDGGVIPNAKVGGIKGARSRPDIAVNVAVALPVA